MADIVAGFYLDALRKLQGAPKVSSPHDAPASLKVERVTTVPATDPQPNYGDYDPDPANAALGCRLTVKQVPGSDNNDVSLYTCYEALGSREDQDTWNAQPETYPFGSLAFPQFVRKYRFFVDEIPEFVLGQTPDTILEAALLIDLQSEAESAAVVILTATFQDIPTPAQQALLGSASGTGGKGVTITFPQESSAWPLLEWRTEMLNSSYVVATNNETCPIPGYTGLVLTGQSREDTPDHNPLKCIQVREYQLLPGCVVISRDRAKLPRQLTSIPLYYFNEDELVTAEQIVAYGTQEDEVDPVGTGILSSKVTATGILKATKTNVVRTPGPIPTLSLAKLVGEVGTVPGTETRQVVPTGTPAVTGFNVISSTSTPLDPTNSEQTNVSVASFIEEVGASFDTSIPGKFLTGFTLEEDTDYVDTTTILSTQQLTSGPLIISCKITPESPTRGKRVTMRLPAGAVLPTLTGVAKNEKGQYVTTVESITDGTAALPALTATTTTASQEPLGGGNFLRTIGTTSDVFAATEYTAEIPITIPEEFRAQALTTTVGTTAAGSAAPPTLGTGQFRITVRQVDEQTVRTETTAIDLAVLPLSIPDTLTNGRGQLVNRVRTLAVGLQTFTPTAFVTGNVVALGNGTSVLTTETVASFGVRQGQTFNEALQIAMPYTEQTEPLATAAALVGQANTTITPEDEQRANVKVDNLTAIQASLAAYSRTYPTTTRIILPPVLKSATILWQTSSDAGSSTETGTTSESGGGSLNLAIPNTAQGGASAIPEVSPTIQRSWSEDLPVIDYFFFVPDNTPLTAGTGVLSVLSKLATLTPGATAVQAWPKFVPVSHTLILKGEHVTARAGATGRISIYLGAASSSGSGSASAAVSQGQSSDADRGSSVRALVIPETIHPALTLAGAASMSSSVTASCSESIGSYTSSSSSVPMTATGTVTGDDLNISGGTASLAATPGVSAIPTSGLYLKQLNVDPFKYGYSMVRARVFDFSSLPLP